MKTGAFLLVGLLTSVPISAQQICKETDTRASCLEAVQSSLTSQAAKDSTNKRVAEITTMVDKKSELVTAKNTGEGTILSVGGPSATNDFLPLLRALIDTGQFSGGQQNGALGLEWSNPLSLPPEHQNKLSVVTVKSKIYEPLQAALRAASLSDSIASLESHIDSADDIAIAFSYSRSSARYGRDPNSAAEIFSSLLALADNGGDEATALRAAARTRSRALEDELQLQHRFPGPFSDVPASKRKEYIAAVEQEHLTELASMDAVMGHLKANGFYGLLDLVNNQPQLTFAASYHKRDASVGSDEVHLTLGYEIGWYNVNSYRATCAAQSAQSACLANYLDREDVRKGLATSPRVSFSLDYLQRQKLDFALDGSAFRYHEDSSKAVKLNAIYARYVGAENATGTRARLDVGLSYEDVSNDPSRQDRGLFTATLSYPVAQGFYLSLGAVYATKPEFRGDVNKELSARAGLVYKVLPSKN